MSYSQSLFAHLRNINPKSIPRLHCLLLYVHCLAIQSSQSFMAPRPYYDDQGRVLSFDQVMQLEKIDDGTFRSVTRAYSPTGGENGTYGGHVYAQAVWAAAQTVDIGFLVHVSGLVPD